MTEQEMLKFVETNVAKLGNEGAINIAPLLEAIITKLWLSPTTGAAPIVVRIADSGTKVETRTTYEVITPQVTLDEYITDANEDKENTRVFVEDKGVLIGFMMLEIDADSITGKAVSNDGEYGIVISRQAGHSFFYHEEVIKAIPETTLGEVEAYKEIFNAAYDKYKRKYDVLIGATLYSLTPGQMMITNEEYNKASTDGNYIGLWAKSKAMFIQCPEWFEGFAQVNLHSAFKNSRKCEIINLNTASLNVSNLTSAFEGCQRLEQISGVINVTSSTPLQDAFKGCRTLHSFSLRGLASSLDLEDCQQLSFATMEELIRYADERAIINISVSRDVKADIDGNAAWQEVRDMLRVKTNIHIVTHV